MTRRKRLVVAGLALLLGAGVFVLWLHPDRITKENYDRIRAGCSPAEVEAILGPSHQTDFGFEALPKEEYDQGDAIALGPEGIDDFEGASDDRAWFGSEGVARVVYFKGRAVVKVWIPRRPLIERLRFQWRKWFPR